MRQRGRDLARVRHGGDLEEARRAAPHAGPWLDLSTGINPHSYPARITPAALTALPQRDAEARLEAAARTAYRVPAGTALVAAPGTQALIQLLPLLVPAPRVAVLGPTYQEHAAAWARTSTVTTAGHLDPAIAADLWVVVNPNNPDGRVLAPETLSAFAAARAVHAAAAGSEAPVLVVDEAFADLVPGATAAGAPHTLVLRSFGKFFGLAGLRLGFAVGAPGLVARLRAALGPWAVSGPALQVGAAALADTAWADAMRATLRRERAVLDERLAAAGLAVCGGTDLFRLVEHPAAARWHRALAREGVWTRTFEDAPQRLRIGLPGARLPVFERALERAKRALRP